MLLELPVIRVQVQLDRIKVGLPPHRRYEPVILREVAELRVTTDGAVGVDRDGAEHLDVHNVRHPHTRNTKGRNGISIMTTGDYAALRQRYGPHLTDGIAGESILLAYAPGLARRALPPELCLAGATPVGGAAEGGVISVAEQPPARLPLTGVHIAKPCVPFAQFCLRRDDVDVDDEIQQALEHLDGGARGYKMTAGGPGVIRPGDVLTLDLPD
jgi:hypothetical protein